MIYDEETHEWFLQRLKESSTAVFCIARWLYSKGWSVTIPATKYAPHGVDVMDYVDNGDLYIQRDGEQERIDIKHLSTDFTCANDWPYDVAIVSSKYPVERADPQPKAYIFVNPSMTHVGIIWNKTREHWFPKDIPNKITKKMETFYVCPVNLVDFRELTND
jgi:hypothetical protein